MIALECPNCGSKLNAKRSLIGQTRNCPKCSAPIQIALPEQTVAEKTEAIPPSDPSPIRTDDASTLPHQHELAKLNRNHYYLVCDRGRVLAVWEGNGKGWMLKTTTGLVSAARSTLELPPRGDFRLVEILLEHDPDGLRLHGLRVFCLVQHWALAALSKGDDEICRKLAGPGGLSREQKGFVRAAIRERYMQDVWAKAETVMEYLANNDSLAPGV